MGRSRSYKMEDKQDKRQFRDRFRKVSEEFAKEAVLVSMPWGASLRGYWKEREQFRI